MLLIGLGNVIVVVALVVRRSSGGAERIRFVRDPERCVRSARQIQIVWVSWLLCETYWLSGHTRKAHAAAGKSLEAVAGF